MTSSYSQALFSLVLLSSFAPSINRISADDVVEAIKPAAVEAEAVEIPVIEPEQIALWIAGLDSDVYDERESATAQLVKADAQAIEALVKAAPEASAEASVRIAHILERIYVNSKSEQSVDASEAALEGFKSLKNATLAGRAELILQSNYQVREKRAVAEIQRLGGSIEYNNLQNINFNRNISVESQIDHIIIGKSWTGGDEGLKHVKRLTQLPVLYYIKGADVSEQAMADLQKAMPATRFQIRNPAYLGIAGTPTTRGCQILTVKEGSAAEEAGLTEGDVIVKFGETEIKDFETLIEEIAAREPGDKVEVTVFRFEEVVKLTVVLGEWM